MKLNLEIERRWLLRKLPNVAAQENYLVSQYYTPEGRFRATTSYSESGDKNFNPETKYFHTIKKTVSHGTNEEQEREITKAEYLKAIESATKLINKIRFIHKEKGNDLKFEVDLFTDTNWHDKFHADLIILEVELASIDQKIHFPYYIENRIIKEITGDTTYSNFNLAKLI